MKYNIDTHEHYSIASITQAQTRTVDLRMSVDLHTERSVESEALEIIYSEALLSGSGEYDRDNFLCAVNLLGASISVSVADSVLSVTLRSTTEVLPKLLKLFSIMLTEPNLIVFEQLHKMNYMNQKKTLER